jgi:hypothetical protein
MICAVHTPFFHKRRNAAGRPKGLEGKPMFPIFRAKIIRRCLEKLYNMLCVGEVMELVQQCGNDP